MKNETTQRIASVLQKTAVQKASVFAMAFMVVGTVAYFGTNVQRDSFAATPPPNAIYISPETGSYLNNETFTAQVRVTTGTEPVNAVQASLNYDPAKLQFVSLAEGTAFPTIAATSTDTPGLIRVARATQATPVTGDNAVVTVTFKMLAAAGSTGVNITVNNTESYIVRSTDNTNIMTSSAGASYSVKHVAPAVTSATPVTGPATGGTVVTITGTGFRTGATVKFGTASATSVTVVSATSITAVTPAHSTGGTKDIVITNTDGQFATLTGGFTYKAAPTVGAISPVSGPVSGGTRVTVTGSGFDGNTTVTIGGVAATAVDVAGATSLSATTGARTAGKVDVVVRDSLGQTGTLTGGFTYSIAPTITSITPNNGPVSGGTKISISGTGFQGGAVVSIGGGKATNVVVVSSTSITATTQANTAGTKEVQVHNTDGQSGSLAGGFTYNAAPAVSSITPNVGYTGGGMAITITGTGFLGGATVSVGGAAASSVVVVNATTITARTPASSTGVKSIVVTNSDGQSATLASAFTYKMSGDVNSDGRINVLDLSTLITRDGQNYPPADFNGDGVVDGADLGILLSKWTW